MNCCCHHRWLFIYLLVFFPFSFFILFPGCEVADSPEGKWSIYCSLVNSLIIICILDTKYKEPSGWRHSKQCNKNKGWLFALWSTCRVSWRCCQAKKSLIKPSDAEALLWDSALNRVIDIQTPATPEHKGGGKDEDVKHLWNIIITHLCYTGKLILSTKLQTETHK